MKIFPNKHNFFNKAHNEVEGKGPWSVDKQGTLRFNGIEHKVTRKAVLFKTKTTSDVIKLATKLNQQLSGGIEERLTLKVGKWFGKRFEVHPSELSLKYGHIALEAKASLADLKEVVDFLTPLRDITHIESAHEKMIKTILALPKSDRKPIFEQAAPLLKRCYFEAYQNLMLQEIVRLNPQCRSDVLNNMTHFLQNFTSATNIDDKIELLRTIAKLPDTSRSSIVLLATPLIDRFSNISDKVRILNIIADLPSERMQQTLELVEPLKCSNIGDIEKFMKIIAGLPNDTRQLTIKHTIPLKLSSMEEIEKVTQIASKMPAENYRKLIDQASPLLQSEVGSDSKVALLEVLSKLPSENIEAVILDAMPLVEIGDRYKEAALTYVANLPVEGRKEFIEQLRPSMSREREGERFQLLSMITAKPEAERHSMVQSIMPLLQKITRIPELAFIGYNLSEVPSAERVEVVTYTLALSPSSQETSSIISAIARIPRAEREEVVAITLSLKQDNTSDILIEDGVVKDTLSLLSSFGDNRQRVLQLARPFFEHFTSFNDKYQILQAFHTLTLGNNTQTVIDEIVPLLQNYSVQEIAAMIIRSGHEHLIEEDFASGTDQSLRIRIAREELENNPMEVLRNLVNSIQQRKFKQLSVEFIGEPGIDASGLGREFISLLVSSVIKKLQLPPLTNGLYRAIPLDPSNKEILNQLGQLMMFCLNSTRSYPLGMIFDHGFFVILTQLKPYYYDRSIVDLVADDAMFEELINLYISMEGLNEKEQVNMQRLDKFSKPFTEDTDTVVLKDLYYSASCNYDDSVLGQIEDEVKEDPAILKQHLPALQAVAREFIRTNFLSTFQTVLPAMLEVAKGMRESTFNNAQDVDFNAVEKMTPQELSEKIQGLLTKEFVVKMLEFDGTIPSEKQAWLKDWLKSTDLDKIKKFVFGMTGAYAIGKLGLKIHNVSSGNINFHTCFNSVDLPFKSIETKEQFDAILEASLTGKEKYSRS